MQIDRPIAIAITLFVILLLIFFLVVPEYRTFKDLQTQLGEKKAEFNAEYDYYSEITKTHFDLQSRADSLKKIDDALPTDSSYGKLIYFLQNKATESGMTIKTLFLGNPSRAGSGNSVKDIVLSLNMVGSYSSLENFIISLEKSSRLFEVDSISFNSGNGEASSGSQPQSQFQIQQIYSFGLEIKTHSY